MAAPASVLVVVVPDLAVSRTGETFGQRLRSLFWASLMLLSAACTHEESPPVSVDLSGADAEIAVYLDQLLTAARSTPSDAGARGALAMAYEVNGFAAAAMTSYEQAESLAPHDPRWPYYQALLEAHRGDLEKALDHLNRSLAEGDSYPPAYMWKGTWLLDLDRREAAEEAFSVAKALGETKALVGLARVALKKRDAGTAISLLRQPLLRQLDEVHPVTDRLLGQAHRLAGDHERADALLSRVTHATPLVWSDERSSLKKTHEISLSAKLERARSRLLAKDDVDTALVELVPLLIRYPEHQGLLGVLSEAYRLQGDQSKEQQVLEQALAAHPDFYPFHMKQADLHIRQGNPANALPHLLRVIELNPDVAWAHAQVGLIRADEGDALAALDAFRHSLATEPLQPVVNYYAGMVEASLGRWQPALAYFSTAVAQDGKFFQAWVARGRTHIELQQIEDARADLSRAAELGAKGPDFQSAMVALNRAGDAQ